MDGDIQFDQSIANVVREVVELVRSDTGAKFEERVHEWGDDCAWIGKAGEGCITEADDHGAQRGSSEVHVVALQGVGRPLVNRCLELQD